MEAMVVAVIAAWAGLLATDANTSSSWVGGAAALTLLTIAIAFNFRNQIQTSRQHKVTEAACRWQISVLVEVLDVNGIPMPSKFWQEPPPEMLKIQESEMKQRKRRIFGMVDEEDGTSILLSAVSMCLVIFVAIVLMMNVFIVKPLQFLKTSRETAACFSALNADYYIAVADALASPPAPSPERERAVLELTQTATRIRNRDNICEDGKPDIYVHPTLPTSP